MEWSAEDIRHYNVKGDRYLGHKQHSQNELVSTVQIALLCSYKDSLTYNTGIDWVG